MVRRLVGAEDRVGDVEPGLVLAVVVSHLKNPPDPAAAPEYTVGIAWSRISEFGGAPC